MKVVTEKRAANQEVFTLPRISLPDDPDVCLLPLIPGESVGLCFVVNWLI